MSTFGTLNYFSAFLTFLQTVFLHFLATSAIQQKVLEIVLDGSFQFFSVIVPSDMLGTIRVFWTIRL